MNNQNEQDTGIMEKQYLDAEEEVPKEQEPIQKNSQKPALPKLKIPSTKIVSSRIKNLVPKLKSPKILIIFSIVLAILIILLAFLRLSSKPNYVQNVDIVDVAQASPNEKTDPQLQNMQKQVESYKNDLKELNVDPNDFTFPQVDLKIQF